MPNMQSCCIRGCDSYKQTTVKNIGYFKFPLHDIFLLKKWLRQINCANWKPSEISQICSAHFKEEDLDRRMDKKYPRLIPASVPTIFPIQRKTARRRRVAGEIIELENDRIEIKGFEPHRNKVSLLKRKPSIISAIQAEEKSGIDLKLRNMLTKSNSVNTVKLVSSDSLIGQKPYLRITINKQINVSTSSKPIPFETIFLPYHEENEIPIKIVKVENEPCDSQNNRNYSQNKFSICDHLAYSKSAVSDISKDRSKPYVRQYTNKMKLKESTNQKSRKQFDLKTVPRDHMYSFPPKVKVQYFNNLKARQESEQLRRRLEELREKRKREQLKIVRLQMHLIELEKKIKENNHEEIVLPNLGQGSKPAGIKSSWLIREKEEYEKLLKDVREIKLKVLRERHNHELEKIRSLRIQMANLRTKMRENDEKEIALSNFKESNNSAVVRPDWMKREEEEYEKLLQDVRKIKQNYKLREINKKQDSVKSDSSKVLKCEKVLSNEDCALIETMQRSSKLIDENETGIGIIDDNDEYGEVIGEIDEDSIDIDMSKEATMLTFNEDLPDPGLLDS